MAVPSTAGHARVSAAYCKRSVDRISWRIVAIIPVFRQADIARLPGFRKRLAWFLENKPKLALHISNRKSPMNRPKLHEQARRAIERLIANRGINAGGRIPSESKLAAELYVSRTTIRRALKDLEQEGKIEHALDGVTIVQHPRRNKAPRSGRPPKRAAS